MKITCSILCYNYGIYLKASIESCLNQEKGDYELEVLVIDDGSTDNTPEIYRQYEEVIRVSRSENQGFGASLTRAIIEASGDYVCLLDADDYFSTNKIMTILPFINSGYLYIDNSVCFIDPDGEVIASKPFSRGGSTSTICLNRSAALSLLPAQNEIFFHPLMSAGCGIKLDNVLTYYRFHDFSMSHSKSPHIWYTHLSEVTHNLSDKLFLMAKNPPSWANSLQLKKISSEFRAGAFYNEMEACLQQKGKRDKILLLTIKIFLSAVRSGLTPWHLKVIIRGLLAKPLKF